MIYTNITKKAIKLMYDKHNGQFDKSGMPYVFHPWHVAEEMSDEYTVAVALLHDTIEDTDLSLEELSQMGFPKEVVEAIEIMTHNGEDSYDEYIERIGSNMISTEVKLADLRHNMDLSRLDKVSESDIKRVEKYKKSYEYLYKIFTKKNNSSLQLKDRLEGGILGLVVGDALGVPVEFIERNRLKRSPVTEMIGYGSHNMPEGTWSDDTSMTIAEIDSIIECGDINYEDIMNKFIEWFDSSKYTATGVLFDVGMSTSDALLRYKSGLSPVDCGNNLELGNGNGSLMRILPFVYFIKSQEYSEDVKINIINDASSLTHGHDISKLGCNIYCDYVSLLLDGADKEDALKIIRNNNYEKFYPKDVVSRYSRLFSEDFKNFSENDISSSGYIVDSLEASIWCTLNSDNYENAVIKAVNLGSDTDTVGAITGSINGIIYGKQDIPDKWMDKLKKRETLEEINDRFLSVLGYSNSKSL